MDAVTSARNPRLKEVRKAVHLGQLTESGLCVAEGFHLLEEALRSGCHIEEVLVAERAREQLEKRVPARGRVRLVILDDRLFATLASTETSQGVIALVRPPCWTIEDVFRGQALSIIVDGLQDPGNAGAILRAAEAFGATGAIFLKNTVNPYNPKALRASGGSVFRLPLEISCDAAHVLAAAGQKSVHFYAATPKSGRSLVECDLTGPSAILIGSEGHGLNPEAEDHAERLRIPTSTVESLNAAVAAAVILYEARRQRTIQGGAAQ